MKPNVETPFFLTIALCLKENAHDEEIRLDACA
jgi:hypothetical protein